MSYGFTGVFCVATLLPIPLAGKLTHSAAQFILSFNPFAAAIQVSSSSLREYPGLWQQNLRTMLLMIVVLLAASLGRVCYLFLKQK